MDPNANLAEQRRIIEQMDTGRLTDDRRLTEAMRLVDLAEALDGWLSKGGRLPTAWSR